MATLVCHRHDSRGFGVTAFVQNTSLLAPAATGRPVFLAHLMPSLDEALARFPDQRV